MPTMPKGLTGWRALAGRRRVSRWIPAGRSLSRIARALERIADGMEEDREDRLMVATQGVQPDVIVSRLTARADRPADSLGPGDVTHLDAAETALVQDFVVRVHEASGRTPDDEEILEFLAQEATHAAMTTTLPTLEDGPRRPDRTGR